MESDAGAEFFGDNIDWATFSQILTLDGDETDLYFSRGLVEKYYEQAEQTFASMSQALEAGDLNKLSSLGHFLKGSSASLGLVKVQNTCEEIQHLDNTGPLAKELLDKVRREHQEVKAKLDAFYHSE